MIETLIQPLWRASDQQGGYSLEGFQSQGAEAKGIVVRITKLFQPIAYAFVALMTALPIGLAVFPQIAGVFSSQNRSPAYPVVFHLSDVDLRGPSESLQVPLQISALEGETAHIKPDDLPDEVLTDPQERRRENRAFIRAFSYSLALDDPRTMEALDEAEFPVPENGVLGLDFDLADLSPDTVAAALEKDIYRQGQFAGRIEMQLNGAGVIVLRPADLERIVPDLPVRANDLENPVSLAELREVGVDLRYDPIADRLVLDQ